MKIIVAPDSFKGSLTAAQAADAIAEGVQSAIPLAEIITLPLADGGEGTVDALVNATGGQLLVVRVRGPLGDPVDAAYGLLGDGDTAVIEMSAAAGLGLVPAGLRNPLLTTTYGVGELIHAALVCGVRKIIVGVGGSATNDGGAGALQALGVRFLDASGRELPPGGVALANLDLIDLSGLVFPRGDVDILVACDVENPLVGPRGAAAVYGPQKGATTQMVELLDRALCRYAEVVSRTLNTNIADLPGGGAAGGLAAGLHAFLGAELRPGIDLVLDAVRFDEHTRDADLIITGEGRIDSQTLSGKTISGVLRRAHGVPMIALAGSVGEGTDGLRDAGLTGIFSMTSEAVTEAYAMHNAASLLKQTAFHAVSSYFKQ
jgi:glycerate 2-kinase